MSKKSKAGKQEGVSKVKIAIGAASLFLFIVGIKRTFRHVGLEERPAAPERDGERDPLGR